MNVEDITLNDVKEAYEKLRASTNLIYETPLLQNVECHLQGKLPNVKSLALKLESMQCTGSFKVRGALNQFLNMSEEDRKNKRTLVTMSAGNYGKAFAYVAKRQSLPSKVFMPEGAPQDRQTIIESYGSRVQRESVTDLLSKMEIEVSKTNALFLHPYDDPVLILGNASVGMEIVKQISTPPDIILVCCGGGGLFSAISLVVHLHGWKCTRVYGVEPENVPKMHTALKAGRPVPFERQPTIATGLASPTAGEQTFKLIKKFSSGVCLVSEEEMKRAMRTLYDIGLVAEPSGAAALAALQANKVPDVEGKSVVVIVTGGNVSTGDLNKHIGNLSV